jgi:endo-1,4-beta-xylanase
VLGARSLKGVGATHGLLTGCAVNTQVLRTDKAYAELVAGQSSVLVAENAMKWHVLHPARGSYAFDEADGMIAFAEARRIKVRGHNLCWHRSIPAWVTGLGAGQGKAVLTEHIERVAGRYAGRMHSWDVVNEAIEVKDGRPDGLRLSPWLALAGPDYIEAAFNAARAADPQALLCYNEYGLEPETEDGRRKRQATLMLLERLKTRGVPVDAVGIQSHLTAGDADGFGAGLMDFLREMRAMELQVFMTEMDVNDRRLPADVALRDAAVAETYGRYLDMVLAEPAVTVVLTWGITDRYTWLNHEGARADGLAERALPFDVDYRPKGAFAALRSSIERRAPARRGA